jgi:hypothetical protein
MSEQHSVTSEPALHAVVYWCCHLPYMPYVGAGGELGDRSMGVFPVCSCASPTEELFILISLICLPLLALIQPITECI